MIILEAWSYILHLGHVLKFSINCLSRSTFFIKKIEMNYIKISL